MIRDFSKITEISETQFVIEQRLLEGFREKVAKKISIKLQTNGYVTGPFCVTKKGERFVPRSMQA